MSTPITFPSLQQNQPYCLKTDVLNLIGNVAPIVNGNVPDAQIASAISAATEYIEQQTNNFFSPRRMKLRLDGNGQSRMVLPYSHVLWINELDVYFTYPVNLARIAKDWDLNVDHGAGILSFPPYTDAPFFAPFAYTFFRSSRNVVVDAWFGWKKSVYGEQLTTTDQLTYSFANPTAIRKTDEAVYSPTAPPNFTPAIYVNGVLQANTVYTLLQNTDASANNVWQVETDNLVYTLNAGTNGYTGITFNSAQPEGTVIEADYDYQYIPADVREACAKKAAITLLTGFATATFADQQFQGMERIQMDGAVVQSLGGQWGPQINWWDTEIATVIKKHKRIPLPYGVGYSSDASFG